MIYSRLKLLLAVAGAALLVQPEAVAQMVVGKTRSSQDKPEQAAAEKKTAEPKATPGMEAAAAAQTKCVELIKEQTRIEKSIANLGAAAKDLEAKGKSLAKPVSAGGSSEQCALQKQQIVNFQDSSKEHYAYLDNIAVAIKYCPVDMAEKLVGMQLPLKKSLAVLESVTIATEGIYAASCK